MEVTDIMTIVGNYAFPIAMCVLMYIQSNKQEERHRAEVKELTAAIANNTTVMERLVSKLG